MAYTNINKSSLHMNTKLYTGTGSSNALTGINFQPDLTWIKKRDGTNYHVLTDAVRLATKQIYSNDNGAEQTVAEGLKSFDSDGFTLGTNGDTNGSGGSYVAWNWKAGTGQGSSNTDGSINTTYTSVNTTAGFSISKYDGTGSNATFGHGLGVIPDLVFWKRLDSNDGAVNWIVGGPALGSETKLVLNTTEAKTTNSAFPDTTSWTNQVISVKTYEGQNDSNGTYVAYAFASKTGYSKIGSYTGNGNADGPFIYTGFKPAFVIIKNSSNAHNWTMIDNKRLGYNDKNYILFPDLSNAEPTTSETDILSNGFKIRASANGVNQSGNTMIYMAFAEAPLVGSNNIPATAR